MLRALFWKEWREQWPVVVAGCAVCVVVPLVLLAASAAVGRTFSMALVAQGTILVCAGAVWPLFAAASGAGTMGSEIADGALGYLLTRPASRVQVWSVKVAAGLAPLLSVVAVSLAASGVLWAVAGGEGLAAVRSVPAILQGRELAWGWPRAIPLAPLSATLLFPFAVLLSTFRMRALAAVGWSVVSTAATLLVLPGGLGNSPLWVAYPIGGVTIVAILVLGASLFAFASDRPLASG